MNGELAWGLIATSLCARLPRCSGSTWILPQRRGFLRLHPKQKFFRPNVPEAKQSPKALPAIKHTSPQGNEVRSPPCGTSKACSRIRREKTITECQWQVGKLTKLDCIGENTGGVRSSLGGTKGRVQRTPRRREGARGWRGGSGRRTRRRGTWGPRGRGGSGTGTSAGGRASGGGAGGEGTSGGRPCCRRRRRRGCRGRMGRRGMGTTQRRRRSRAWRGSWTRAPPSNAAAPPYPPPAAARWSGDVQCALLPVPLTSLFGADFALHAAVASGGGPGRRRAASDCATRKMGWKGLLLLGLVLIRACMIH